MADKTISQLTAATSVLQTDVLPIVNDSETKKISIANLFNSPVNLSLSGLFKINGTSALSSSGIITQTEFLSELSNATESNVSLSLAAGSAGLFKMLSVISANSTITVNVSGGNGFTTITFNSIGDSCLLYYTNKWHIVSNNGGVIA